MEITPTVTRASPKGLFFLPSAGYILAAAIAVALGLSFVWPAAAFAQTYGGGNFGGGDYGTGDLPAEEEVPTGATGIVGSGPLSVGFENTGTTTVPEQPEADAVSTPSEEAPAPSFAFTRDLERGDEGEEVRQLQIFLNSKGFLVAERGNGSPGNETDYFGPATERALAKYQAANGITPSVGYFGPKTRAAVMEASAGTATPSTQNRRMDEAPGFTRDLEQGSTGEDVRVLQEYLNSEGFIVSADGPGSPGNETDYFGPATEAALAKYQAANGITPSVGYFGPKTRAFIAEQ